MLDFAKAMEIAKRICKEHDGNEEVSACKLCPLNNFNGEVGCAFVPSSEKANMSELERFLLEWDKAHPEPRYPTWDEWQDKNFPNNTMMICPNAFYDEPFCDDFSHCSDCIKRPIPADIAKKLGIEPIKEG